MSRPPPGSRVLPAEELTAYERWEAPSVGAGSGAGRPSPMAPVTAERIEAIERAAREEGYARGHAEGLKAGQAEMNKRVRQVERVLQALARPLEALDEQVEQALTDLAIAIARQIIRRELRTDPGQVVAVVREAVGALPIAARQISVSLHPQDAALVREALSLQEGGPWRLVDDPVLQRGDCRVATTDSAVDATLERRLAQVVAQILGGERNDDAPAG